MANFAVTNGSTQVGGIAAGSSQAAMTTTYKTLITIGNSTGSLTTVGGQLRRGKIYDILIGTNATPADNYLEFEIGRITMGASTVLGGGLSSLSSNMALDPADNTGCVASVGNNSSIETAYSYLTQPWYIGINQRASYRWVAAPGGEIVYPATSSATGNNGVGLRCRSGGFTGTATGTVHFSEQ